MHNLTANITEAEKALTEKPLLATSAERFLILDEIKSSYKDLPQPLRFSRILSELLGRVSTPLEPYDRIAGRCVDRLLTEDEEARFSAYLTHPDYPSRQFFLSSGHCTYSWEMLVEYGLVGLKQQATEARNHAESAEKKVFFSAILEIYDAITNYLLRYADAAEKIGLVDVASNLRVAATERPSTFASALQLLWIVTLIDCAYITENPTLTVGRIDKILLPLYEADLSSGRLTRDDAKAYITDYYCKHNLIMGRGEHQVGDETNSTTFKRICCFDAPQYLMLAGYDEDGTPTANDLSLLFAECIEPSFKNPVIVVRYFKDLDTRYPALWRALTEKALKSASLMFYNDDNVIRTFRRIGIPEKDCYGHAHFGCNWPSLGDKSAWVQGSPNSSKIGAPVSEEEREYLRRPYMRMSNSIGWPEEFMRILREFSEKPEGSVTIDDFYDSFLHRMGVFLDHKLAYLSKEIEVRKRVPSACLTFGDCFRRSALKTGECFSASAVYHFELQSFQMFGTVVDSFIVVDQLVFRDHLLTLSELLRAVEDNFEHAPHILALCRKVPKYGSDTPHSNYHVKRLSESVSTLVIEKSRPYFESEHLFLAPCMQSDTWHLKNGEKYGATPDGRLAHTPFSQNSRPSNGACTGGITGMFNSMLCLPANGLLSGALNLDVSPSQFAGENGHALFSTLLATYLNRGGLHAQVTAVSADALRDAQVHPDLHRDLRVRVTGYSGVFVDICERLQNDIIDRFQ